MGVLTVFLEKLTHLRDEDFLGKSDPYVTFELEKDNWVFDQSLGKNKSSVKKNTCNPVFEETFEFENVPTTDNMLLHVKVWDEDVGKDDNLGKCIVKLEKLGIESGGEAEIEQVIDNKKGEGWFSRKARAYLKVKFEP